LSSTKPKKLDALMNIARECIRLGKYRDTMHAAQRREQRQIPLPEILHVLNTGRHEKAKDRFDEAFHEWNYAIRGQTLDEQDLRVIISFDGARGLLLITAFYLEKGG
jgi:hypothetical protein